MSQLRNFVFTINNYTADSMESLKSWDAVTYLVFGREVGESGTPHLQGYCELKASKKFDTIKRKIPTAHIEKRFGTAQQAADYCKKEDDYEEQGEISNQGKRSDLEFVTGMIKEKCTMREVAEAAPVTYVKYHKGLQALKAVLIEPRNEVPKVTVLYGKTGVGKSRMAREITEDAYVWRPQCGQWFDGYEGQKDAIFEEFRGQISLGFMLSILDRYDCKVQYKGGMIEFAATNIVITTPKHPREWYEHCENDKIDQLLRRITEIKMLE